MPKLRRGFTLVELLTAIAILGLLIALVFPSLSTARQKAKANVCLSQLKGLGNGVVVYLTENKDTFFPVRMDRIHPTAPQYYVNSEGQERPRWQWFIQTGMGPVVNPEPFRKAGTIPFGDETLARANPLTMTVDVFSCPALVDTEFVKNIRDGAYGYNYQYLGNTRMETNLIRWDNFAVRLHEIKAPSRTVTLADSRGAGPKHGPHSFALDPPRLAIEKNAKRFGPSAEDTAIETQQYSPAETRHVGRTNVVFADAHGESMTLEDLGYEVSDGSNYPNHKRGEPVPILKPDAGPYKANNQLWNGKGIDEVAAKANVPP